PGITLGRGNNHRGGRGLGTSGDLLINGKRVAGKDNSTSSQLTRIASDQVERIEIIGGSSGEMDVRGSFSYGGQAGALNYLFNLEVDPRYNGFQRTEFNYLPDRSLSEIVLEDSDRDQSAVQASMNLGYDFERDRLQFNALKSEFCRDRLRFDGLVGLGTLREIEDSCSAGGGQKIALKIHTTF
ncbi:MAG: hypothetical protein RL572_333, partial [Pseudomonadota bacterium]